MRGQSSVNDTSIKKPRSFMRGLAGKLTLATVISGLIIELATQSLSPVIISAAADTYDRFVCGGAAAQAEGDRLSKVALQNIDQAQEIFAEANTHYEKAYACGFQDAGIRLAFAHCTGLGVPKEPIKARAIVLQIERAHENMAGRDKDLRAACNL